LFSPVPPRPIADFLFVEIFNSCVYNYNQGFVEASFNPSLLLPSPPVVFLTFLVAYFQPRFWINSESTGLMPHRSFCVCPDLCRLVGGVPISPFFEVVFLPFFPKMSPPPRVAISFSTVSPSSVPPCSPTDPSLLAEHFTPVPFVFRPGFVPHTPTPFLGTIPHRDLRVFLGLPPAPLRDFQHSWCSGQECVSFRHSFCSSPHSHPLVLFSLE